MTTTNISHSAKRHYDEDITAYMTSGEMRAGYDDSYFIELATLYRFVMPGNIVGATINSAILDIDVDNTGYPADTKTIIGVADTGTAFASVNLNEGAGTIPDVLLGKTIYNLSGGDYVVSQNTVTTVSVDLTSSLAAALSGGKLLSGGFNILWRREDEETQAYLSDANVTLTLALDYTPAGDITSTTLAAETDTANAVSIANARTYSMSISSEIDSGLSLSIPKIATLAIAVSSESGVSITIARSITIGIASETDSATSPTIAKTSRIVAGIPAETDSALSATIQKDQTVSVDLASESDSALDVTATSPQSLTIGLASEASSASDVTIKFGQIIIATIATETDSTNSVVIGQNQAISLGQASESNVANAITATNVQGVMIRQFFQLLAG